MKTPSNYKLVKTSDGSFSLYSEKHEQLMHTQDGAYAESFQKHVFPSRVFGKINNEIRILDVGFGIGYNILCALMEGKASSAENIEIISLEYDRSIADFLPLIKFGDERDSAYGAVVEAFNCGKSVFGKFGIKVLFGDARQSVKKLKHEGLLFDAVFHDPFSPAKNPELWTVDYFRMIRQIMAEECILTTYSCAFQIRRAMIEAGMIIGNYRFSHLCKNGTLASNSPCFETLTGEEVDAIFAEVKSQPYEDEEFIRTREEIISLRREKMAARRILLKR